MVQPKQMLGMLQILSHNRKLKSLNLAHNVLLQEESNLKRVFSGKSFQDIKPCINELSEFNLSLVACFKDLIKYNAKLEHLNLESCSLNHAALIYISALLRKS